MTCPKRERMRMNKTRGGEFHDPALGFPLMIKSRRMAYDGKGNAVAKTAEDVAEAATAAAKAVGVSAEDAADAVADAANATAPMDLRPLPALQESVAPMLPASEVPAIEEEVTMEGYLMKKRTTGFVKSWDRRYLRLVEQGGITRMRRTG